MQEVLDKINERRMDALTKLNTSLAEAQQKFEETNSALEKFELLLPNLVVALASVHLTFSLNNHFYTGLQNANFCAKPTDKFKFITFRGYTARGRGRNQEALDKKAQKLEEIIKEKIGYRVAVNPFSLEVKDSDQEERKLVLIDIIY